MTRCMHLSSERDTDRLGEILAEHLATPVVVVLSGTLGAGKTRLVQAIAAACGVPQAEVTSPTFTLWQTYEAERTLHHLDAYRIADEDEFDALGIVDAYDEDALILIEWGERVENSLPCGVLWLRLDVASETARTVTLDGPWPDSVIAAIRTSGMASESS